MSEYAIQVENLGKQYFIDTDEEIVAYKTFQDQIINAVKFPARMIRGEAMKPKQEVWALKNVSFNVKHGQVLGVIGRNGAGKSTLLKLLSRVTEPTTGYAKINGRVGSLLEVGTGFHPELSGRENIYLNGAILGMKRTEITRKLDEIIDFSGVGKYIDTPVKRYSSGMYLRLAFSVSAHMEPEILVVDEVLAVGDAEFQRKCIGKMSDVAGEGRTVLFVSHDMSAILRLTDETIVLDKGTLQYRAETTQAIDYYMSSGFSQTGEYVWDEKEFALGQHNFQPKSIKVMNKDGHVSDIVMAMDDNYVELEYELKEDVRGLRVGIYLYNMRGEMIFTSFDTDNLNLYSEYEIRKAGKYKSRCKIPAQLLNEGQFSLSMNASVFKVKRYFQGDQLVTFMVDGTSTAGKQWKENRRGAIRPSFDWTIEEI